MLILALDTSANICAAALFDSEQHKTLSHKSEDIGRGHAERLMGLLDEVLKDGGKTYSNIDLIAVTTGPGSFTGIRVGLATARGLSLGLNIPVAGVTILEAIAFQQNTTNSDETPIVVAMDAKRGEIFTQVFSSKGEQLSNPQAVKLEEIGGYLPKAPFRTAGSAAGMVAQKGVSNVVAVLSEQTTAGIEYVARFAATIGDLVEKPSPLYLRSADAKPQTGFAVARKLTSQKQTIN